MNTQRWTWMSSLSQDIVFPHFWSIQFVGLQFLPNTWVFEKSSVHLPVEIFSSPQSDPVYMLYFEQRYQQDRQKKAFFGLNPAAATAYPMIEFAGNMSPVMHGGHGVEWLAGMTWNSDRRGEAPQLPKHRHRYSLLGTSPQKNLQKKFSPLSVYHPIFIRIYAEAGDPPVPQGIRPPGS